MQHYFEHESKTFQCLEVFEFSFSKCNIRKNFYFIFNNKKSISSTTGVSNSFRLAGQKLNYHSGAP
jgi:hypothetical protein